MLNNSRICGLGATIVFFGATLFAQNPATYTVGSIEIHRVEGFDTLDHWDNNFLGRFLNSIHALTNDNVIRRELLLKQGDGFLLPLLEESERNLRTMDIIADPRITIDTVQDRRSA